MKSFTILLVSALSFASTAVVANPGNTPTVGNKKTENRTAITFETSAYITKDAAIRLAVKKNAPERVYITLRDAGNTVIYSETINKNEMSYAAKINVNDLTDGAYKLEISTGKDRVVKRLNLSSSKIETQRSITVN